MNRSKEQRARLHPMRLLHTRWIRPCEARWKDVCMYHYRKCRILHISLARLACFHHIHSRRGCMRSHKFGSRSLHGNEDTKGANLSVIRSSNRPAGQQLVRHPRVQSICHKRTAAVNVPKDGSHTAQRLMSVKIIQHDPHVPAEQVDLSPLASAAQAQLD
jgi:hypothetical protein